MCPVRYYDIIRDYPNPYAFRIKIVQYCHSNGISATARQFGTTRDTVRKWVRQYAMYGTKGLNNKPRIPKRIPHKTPKYIEDKVLKYRDELKSWGPVRLKDDFDLPISTASIYRILKQNNRIKEFRKKYKRQRDLRLIKMRMKAFEKIQVDVKDLSDIPRYWKLMRLLKLPRYQYTARDVKSGLLFIAYARKNDCVNAANFLTILSEHLRTHDIDLSKVIIQTDNGVEFIGNWKQKSASLFTHMTEEVFKMSHERIPVGRSTYNSDVETSHLRIERDLYDLEDFSGDDSLSIKAFMYQLYFNLLRKNRVKFNKTSYEIVSEEHPGIKPTIGAFSPIILDDLGPYYMKYVNTEACGKTVEDVPYHTTLTDMKYNPFFIDI
jgi:transposase